MSQIISKMPILVRPGAYNFNRSSDDINSMKQHVENIRKALQKEEKRNVSMTQEIIESRTLVSTLKVSFQLNYALHKIFMILSIMYPSL